MILILHIAIAVTSLIFSTYLLFSPSRAKLNASYWLVLLTMTSGTYLVLTLKTNILKTCLTGLVYLAVSIFSIIAVRNKLTSENIRQ